MAKRKKVKTPEQDYKRGNSKYARKVAKRKKLAKQLGLPPETPYPILNLYI